MDDRVAWTRTDGSTDRTERWTGPKETGRGGSRTDTDAKVKMCGCKWGVGSGVGSGGTYISTPICNYISTPMPCHWGNMSEHPT